MKKIVSITMFCLLLAGVASATIKGNGVRKNEQRAIGSFTALAASGPMNVEISYGPGNTLDIEGDENILPYIETFVKNGTLKIKVKDLTIIKPTMAIKVKINMTTLTGIAHSGSGSIIGTGAFSNDEKTSFSVSGSGNIRLGFEEFNAADIQLSGSGMIQLTGEISNTLNIRQSGSGKIDCSAATCTYADVKISGSGNAKINTTGHLSVNISGSGKVLYTGPVTTVDSHISGSGRIERM